MQQQYGYDREIEAIVDLMDRVSSYYLSPLPLAPSRPPGCFPLFPVHVLVL